MAGSGGRVVQVYASGRTFGSAETYGSVDAGPDFEFTMIG